MHSPSSPAFAINSVAAWTLIRAGVSVAVGLLVAKIASSSVRRISNYHGLELQQANFFRRSVFYTILLLTFFVTLHQLGVSPSALLGTAGILSVAIGFASQTSASNIISGLFLIGEKPFEIGDYIQVGNESGEILSIDLLSVKLRTFNNLYVRVPNESLIKTNVTNLTRFPIRRYDLQVPVAYKEDLERVREILENVAERNPICLTEPTPLLIFQGFGDSSINIQFSVWARREKFLDLRNSITLDLKKAFDEEGIKIPFPHRSLYAGEATKPFPVEVVSRPGTETSEPGPPRNQN